MKRKSAYFQVTRKCNNECVFCSNPQFEKEYSFDEAKERVLKFKKNKITEIILTGGEPTECTFVADLIKYIKSRGIDIRMISNGVNLSDYSLVINLQKAGLNNINISIHSHLEDVSDRLTSRKGHWQKTKEGIQNCIKAGINVNINTTINSANCKHLEEFMLFMVKKFPKIHHFIFNGLDPGNADGKMKSRAGTNSWIVPKLTEVELQLKKAIDVLKKHGKTFRVERVPLCYMECNEQYSTETRKIVKEEKYVCYFLEKDSKNELRTVTPGMLRVKADC